MIEAGGVVSEDATVEINPYFAVEPEQLKGKLESKEYSGDVYLSE